MKQNLYFPVLSVPVMMAGMTLYVYQEAWWWLLVTAVATLAAMTAERSWVMAHFDPDAPCARIAVRIVTGIAVIAAFIALFALLYGPLGMDIPSFYPGVAAGFAVTHSDHLLHYGSNCYGGRGHGRNKDCIEVG